MPAISNDIKEKNETIKHCKWLVTTTVYTACSNLPVSFVTKTIKLKEDETPVDWFLDRVSVYPTNKDALINFWKI